MITRGQKRKLSPEDVDPSDRSSLTWESQRQFVFSVSLIKYQRGQELAEPSLRRSVLIANTLRQVSVEPCSSPSGQVEVSPAPWDPSPLEQEQVLSGSSVPKQEAAGSHSGPPTCRSTGGFCTCVPCAPPSVPEEDEDWSSISTDPDFSLSAAISSIITVLDSSIDISPQAAPRTPLRSLENLQVSPEGGASWLKQGVRGHGRGSWVQEECRWRESSVEAMRSSYLSDVTVEDLFQDIDTSLLEREVGMFGLRGGMAGGQAGDDLLRCLPPLTANPFSSSSRCLPSFSSFSSPSAPHCLSVPTPAPVASQCYTREGLELDHLMEILVES